MFFTTDQYDRYYILIYWELGCINFPHYFLFPRSNGSTQNIYNELLKDTVAGGQPSRSNGPLNVLDSYTSDLDERAVDIVMGDQIASQQYKVRDKLVYR